MPVTKIDLATQAAGVLPATSIPNPSVSTLGGVQSLTGAANQFLTGVSVAGVPQAAQPAFSNISGNIAATQAVGLTGDVTSTTGGVSTTVVKINGVSLAALTTGLLKNTTATGAPSVAVAGTDYLAPAGSSAALSVGSAAAFGVLKVDGTTIVATAGVLSLASTPGIPVYNETPGGTPNGALATFTLAFAPINSSLLLSMNGALQDSGAGNDYTISGLTITMLNIPITGAKLRAYYSR